MISEGSLEGFLILATLSMVTKPNLKSIHSRAPTRIDLAGGTIDIWPLYLFLKNPITLNLGIDLYAEATIDLAPLTHSPNGPSGGMVSLRSEDQNVEARFLWTEIDQITDIPPGLQLHYKLLKYFTQKRNQAGISDFPFHLTLSTRAQSPAGAGLGGSSTLSIAMIGALATWAANSKLKNPIDPERDGESFIEIVRDVETTVIRVPAGLQDYYGAMYGGLQSLRWGAGTHEREWLPEDLISELNDRILLFYSGQSRNSGINNWTLFKGFIDQQDDIRAKFEKISAATAKLETYLKNRNWLEVGQTIREEWETRKTLAPGIATPEIDSAFAEAQKLAPVSGKVCGAGGGGCFFIYLPIEDPEKRKDLKAQIQKIFLSHGMKNLNFHGVPRGLEVKVTRA